MNADTAELSDTESEAPATATTEINFEDLIKVSNVIPQGTKDEEDEEKSITTSSITTTTNSLTTTNATNSSTITTASSSTTSVASSSTTSVASSSTTSVASSSTTTVANASTTTVTTISAVTPKIVQKLTTSVATAVTKSNSPGQVVIIQGPSGTSVPIRIATSGTVSNQSNNQNKQVTIQVLKMPDGNFVQIKNNKALNLTNLSNVAHMNIGTKKGTNGQNQPIIIKSVTASPNAAGTTQTKVITSSANLGTQLLKSVSSVDNQKLATLTKAKIIENTKQLQKTNSTNQNSSMDNAKSTVDTTNAISSTATNTVTTTSNTTTKPTVQKLIVSESKEILLKSENKETVKSESDGAPKQIIVPHHVLKLSSNSPGTVQAIQIPGKPGLQYVRVLGTTASTMSTSTTKNLNSISDKILSNTVTISSSKDTSSPSTTATAQVSTGQKIILNTKARQNSSPIILNKDTVITPHTSSSTIKLQSSKSILTTFPTLKKITENGKSLTLIKKDDSEKTVSNQSQEKHKITQLNQQLHNLIPQNNKLSNGQKLTSSKTPQLFMVSKEFLKKMQTSNDEKNIEIITTKKSDSPPTPQKKLFSVLKPSHHDSDSSVAIVTNDSNISLSSTDERRSPSPPEGPRRKHCNCTKSQCLKLYCDCFANGEFCQDCNCKECFNNLENENERQKAIQICLERNPNAFKPKITKARDQSDLRLHNKGCNCKRSGCLKNYCECYEAKIVCSSNCKCLGCRNVEDRSDIDQTETTKITQNYNTSRGNTLKRSYDEIGATSGSSEPANKQAYNFITEDVVDATVQCMFAQTDECKKSEINAKNSERMIIEELGRCLVEIIDFSIRNMDN